MTTMVFAKKITPKLAWLRKVQNQVPIMRVQGIADLGTEELSDLGPFIRWTGKFQAQVVQRPPVGMEDKAPQGVLVGAQSYTLILPSVAQDWLASYFVREDQAPGKRDKGDKRTGTIFKPAQALDSIRFVLDIGLQPPSGDKESQTGYEYFISIAQADPRYNPMAGLDKVEGLTAFGGGLFGDAGQVVAEAPKAIGAETALDAAPKAGAKSKAA